jgi:hypothetical protein
MIPVQFAQYGVAIFTIAAFVWLLYKIFVPKQVKPEPELVKIIEANTAAFCDHAAASRENAIAQKELIEVIRQYGSVMNKYEDTLEKFSDSMQKQTECLTELRVEIARKEKIQ